MIFSNSTVDLKNVTLNEELLKVEGEDVQVESVEQTEVSRSQPNIKCDYGEEEIDPLEKDVSEGGITRRSESEPSLNTCNEIEDGVK